MPNVDHFPLLFELIVIKTGLEQQKVKVLVRQDLVQALPGSACTSTIYFRKENKTGICNIKYVASHYGHANEIRHLRLLTSDRAEVAEKLAKGVSVSR